MSKLRLPSVIKKKISLSSFLTKGNNSNDETVSDFSSVAFLTNFDCGDGTLKQGVGISGYKIDGKEIIINDGVYPIKVFYYKRYDNSLKIYQDRLVVFASDNKLYYITLKGKDVFHLLSGLTFKNPPISINYNFSGEDVLILSFKDEGLYILNDLSLKRVDSAPKITSMCIHSERLFATTEEEGSSLWFSDDFNPTNWSVSLDEAGFIELPDERGKLLKVISFLDYVYVFRSYGISRIYAFGDQSDFTVDNLYNNLGKIYANTVTECGGYVIFLTSSGLYRFNGIDAVKILPYYDKYINGVENEDAKGIFYNGKLYLSLKMNLNGKFEKVLLVYDIESKVPYIAKGLKIDDLELVSGEDYNVYLLSSGKLSILNNEGTRFDRPLKKSWESGKSDFSLDTNNKYLDKVYLKSNCDITFYVTADNNTYIYNLNAGENQLKLRIKGNTFKFKIVSYAKTPKIYKPTFFFTYIKENLW